MQPQQPHQRRPRSWPMETKAFVVLAVLGCFALFMTSEWLNAISYRSNNVWSQTDEISEPIIQRPNDNDDETNNVTPENELLEDGVIKLTEEEPPIASSNGRRLEICVTSVNPRTASIFHSHILKRYGDGKFDYQVASSVDECPESTKNNPMVRMLYQITLRHLNKNQLDNLFDNSLNMVFIMGDEYCKCKAEICSNRAHARQYFSSTYSAYATSNPDPSHDPTVYLPLGPRNEFPIDLQPDVVPTSTRQYLLNLIVSPTSPTRLTLAKMVQKQFEAKEVFLHVTQSFEKNASESRNYIKPHEYQNVLKHSKFTLCPAGNNPESYRIYEAAESGSIPVLSLDREYQNHRCKDAFRPLLDSGAPFVFLNTWEELPGTLAELVKDPEALDKRQQEIKLWFGTFWKTVAKEFECSLMDLLILKNKNSNMGFDFQTPECLDNDKVGKDVTTVPLPLPSRFTPTPLITGCGRSGTLSLQQYLESIGVKSTHEGMTVNGISVSWLYAIPTSRYYPFETPNEQAFRRRQVRLASKNNGPLFGPVIHVLRHPLKVISSTRRCFCGRGTRSTGLGKQSDAKSWRFVDDHIKMPKPNLPYDSLLRSMVYWLEWNLNIPVWHKVDATFKIEELNPNEVIRALGLTVPAGVEVPDRVPRAPLHISPEAEREALPDATWAELIKEDVNIAEKIFELAKKYGYESGEFADLTPTKEDSN